MVLKKHNSTIDLNFHNVPPFGYDNMNISLEDTQMKSTN